jgi:hypothetical protein
MRASTLRSYSGSLSCYVDGSYSDLYQGKQHSPAAKQTASKKHRGKQREEKHLKKSAYPTMTRRSRGLSGLSTCVSSPSALHGPHLQFGLA